MGDKGRVDPLMDMDDASMRQAAKLTNVFDVGAKRMGYTDPEVLAAAIVTAVRRAQRLGMEPGMFLLHCHAHMSVTEADVEKRMSTKKEIN